MRILGGYKSSIGIIDYGYGVSRDPAKTAVVRTIENTINVAIKKMLNKVCFFISFSFLLSGLKALSS